MLHQITSSHARSTPSASGFAAEATGRMEELGALAARRLLAAQPELVVLDVRMPVEHVDGRIADGVNLDFFEDDFCERLARLDRKTPYLLYCRSGGRSRHALELLERLGFEHVHHMACGFDGWVEAGLPTRSGEILP